MVDKNNLLALTAATPLEEKQCVVTGKEPPQGHMGHRMMCSDSSESRKQMLWSACGSQGKVM